MVFVILYKHCCKCSYPTNKAEHTLQYHFGRCQDDTAENWKRWNKIILKCVNNIVKFIFNEKIVEKKSL